MISPQAIIATIRINLLRRPLMHSSVAEECLDISRGKLNSLIESGALPWAWNLSCGGARAEIRVLAACVVERLAGPLPGVGATRNLQLPEVVNLSCRQPGRMPARVLRAPAWRRCSKGDASHDLFRRRPARPPPSP